MAFCVILSGGTIGNILQLIGLIIVFIIILFATYYTSKWIGKSSLVQQNSGNIRIVETFRLSQTKYLQIVKAGTDRYFLIAVSKDDVTFIAELDESELTFRTEGTIDNSFNFAEVLKKIKKKDK